MLYQGVDRGSSVRRVPRTVPGAEYYNPAPIAVDQLDRDCLPVFAWLLGLISGWISLAGAIYLAGGHFG